MPDIGFNAAPVDTAPDGLHFAAEVGPTGGPYDTSEFFQGVVSTEALGTWAQRDSIFGLCFNQDHCTPTRLVPNRYDFAWTWEASYQPSTSSGTLIENNVGVTYADGTNHRPWAFDILTDQKAAVLNFSSTPGQVNFQINQNGNVAIGPATTQPAKQLEVIGDALFTQDVDVSGNLTVAGANVVTTPGSGASSGPLQWGISNGGALGSAAGICSASRLGCRGGVLPNGTPFACSVQQAAGTVFFALCQ